MPSFLKYVAEVLSIVMAAPFISLYVLVILYLYRLVSWIIFCTGVLFLTILPIIISLGLAKYYKVEWDYVERSKRVVPLLLISISYGVYTLFIFYINGYQAFFLALSYLLNGLVSLLITLKYKISLHIVGIAGPAAYLILTRLFIEGLSFYILSIPLSLSRIYLKRHTIGQICSGYVVSAITTYISYIISTLIWGI